jgi:hypothetical protein
MAIVDEYREMIFFVSTNQETMNLVLPIKLVTLSPLFVHLPLLLYFIFSQKQKQQQQHDKNNVYTTGTVGVDHSSEPFLVCSYRSTVEKKK